MVLYKTDGDSVIYKTYKADGDSVIYKSYKTDGDSVIEVARVISDAYLTGSSPIYRVWHQTTYLPVKNTHCVVIEQTCGDGLDTG